MNQPLPPTGSSWYRAVRLLSFAVVWALVLVACSPSDGGATTTTIGSTTTTADSTATTTPESTTTTEARDPDPLSVALQANVNYAALFLGLDRGIFLKHGIDLDLNIQASIPNVILSLQSNESQIGAGTASAVIPANLQGLPLQIFVPLIGRPDVVNYDEHQAITVNANVQAETVADLRGLRVGFPFGGGTANYVRGHLRAAGLDPDSDVELFNLPFVDMVAALTSGAIDAVGTSEPFGAMQVAMAPGARTLVRGGEMVSIRVGLFASSDWIEANRDLFDRFVAAILESSQLVRTDLEAAIEVTSNYLPNLDREVLAEAMNIVTYDPRWSDLVEAGFEAERQEMLERPDIDEAPTIEEFLALEVTRNYESRWPEFFNDLR